MLKIALTGGIATGKSHVLARMAALGIPTIDADRVARDVVRPSSLASGAIRSRFGEAVFDDQDELDRKALAALIFSDPDARRDLEAIIHPAVYRAVAAWFSGLPPATALAVADIPLLYETDREADFDLVIVTACSPEMQIDRLRARDGISEDEARQRLDAQWPIEEKVRRADRVIDTSGTKDETDRQVDGIVAELRAQP